MKTMHYLRKTTTVVSGAALLLALASSAFARGGGNTPVTNLQGVTITPNSTGTCFTVRLASSADGGGTFSYALNGTLYPGEPIAQINGLYIFNSPNQVTTTGEVPTGFTPDLLIGGDFGGATGYSTPFATSGPKKGSPILPGDIGRQFCFSANPGPEATFLLDISQGAPGLFNPTGLISFKLPPRPSAVPEPSSVATLAVGSLGLMGMVLSARKRRRANDMI